jgi:uncharacterized repeat protein (TIGR03803 family)
MVMARLQILFIALAFLAGFNRVAAQTFTNLYRFTVSDNFSNSDGAHPYTGLAISGNTLYGTTGDGGTNSLGVLFSINTDGTDFKNLHTCSFADGYLPYGGFILLGNTLYGTTFEGGSSGWGTVFAMNTDGTGYTIVHGFSGPFIGSTDGTFPYDSLVLSGNALFGTTAHGGSLGEGVVYMVNTDGTGYTNLYNFTGGTDGYNVESGLVLAGNTLYGVTGQGGTFDYGTVYAINTDGSGFTNLYSFNGDSDGSHPYSKLIVSGDTLYGTASDGGPDGKGTVFAIKTNGADFTVLHSFTAFSNNTNGDGANPFTGLAMAGNTLYGVANDGGNWGWGTVFAVNTDGTGFTNLYSFTGGSDGAWPIAVTLSGSTLYGTTQSGGNSGSGTVFALNLVPTLGIATVGSQVVLSWPAWSPNFSLQTTTNLASPAWAPVFLPQVLVNGQNMVTNPISGNQQFYRLIQ